MKQFSIEIKKNAKEYNEYSLVIKGATEGKLLAIRHALESGTGPVGQDVLDVLKPAMERAGIRD